MIELVREFGLPTALLIIILLFAATGLRWFARSIVQPMLTAHLDLITHLQSSLNEQAQSHKKSDDDHIRILNLLKDK